MTSRNSLISPRRPALRAALGSAARTRTGRVTAAVTVVALGTGLTAGAVSAGRETVTLTVDGESRDVTSRADTVAEVLDAAGVAVGAHDELVPAAGSPVRDGSTVTLRRAREVLLTVDGRSRTVHLAADSVGEVLDALALRAGTRASASRSSRVPRSLTLTTPKRLTVVVGARRIPLVSAYPTVREALLQAGVRLAPADRVSAPAESAPQDGQVITVEQVRSAVEREEVRLAYDVVTRTDDELADGRRRVESAGRAGVLLREWTTTYTDGTVTSRVLRGERVLRAPVPRVVVVGTRPQPAAAPSRPAPSSSSGDGLNWAALAQCESGGNPRAVSPSGQYRGLYQFSMGTWRSVGGQGDPIDASSAEQTRRAQMLYARAGRSPWPHCGSRL